MTSMTIAAIGDIHVQESTGGAFKELFAAISKKCDVLLLCGDLTDSGMPHEAHILADNLSALSIPVGAVLGNHDHDHGREHEIREVLRTAGVHFLDKEPLLLNGVGVVGVKGFSGGFGKYMLGSFGEEPTKRFVAESVDHALRLEHLLQELEAEKILVALHYSPILETVVGESLEIYPFLGSSRLGETIDRFPVTAVFHGHAHRGTHTGKTQGGVPVYNVSRELLRKEHMEYFCLKV